MCTAYSLVAAGLSRSSNRKTPLGETDSERHYSERVPSPSQTTTSASQPADRAAPRDPTELSLSVRQPFNASIFFSFLEGRGIPAIEAAGANFYRRRVGDVWIEATMTGQVLQVRIPSGAAARAPEVIARLRRVFDLDVDPKAVDRRVAEHPKLAPLVQAGPGIRVPGVWDPFEGAVRAVLGQQVSVARARDLASALCERFGADGFPDPQTLADAEVAAIGLPGMRGRAISAIAQRVVDDGVEWLEDAESLRAGFVDIPGLGPWTAEYAAMRVSRDPDAFPDSDWGVVKALGVKGAAARRWAEPCRPWRAYAVMHLWSSRAA